VARRLRGLDRREAAKARQHVLPFRDPRQYARLARVTSARPVGTDEQPSAPRVRIVHLSGPVFRALAHGDLAAANAVSPVPLSGYFAGPEWTGVWKMRSEQVDQDPSSAAWVTGVIWDEQQQVAVGRAGYHGPPDQSGMVEIGYAVDPAYRRRGYARAALEALLARAARESGVQTVRVSISPGNTPSYNLASQYGFAQVGEQWDEEDGLEIIYEVPAGRYPSSSNA
jgi:RimJ/RimL family protein N-acetyltransferase